MNDLGLRQYSWLESPTPEFSAFVKEMLNSGEFIITWEGGV